MPCRPASYPLLDSSILFLWFGDTFGLYIPPLVYYLEDLDPAFLHSNSFHLSGFHSFFQNSPYLSSSCIQSWGPGP